MTGVWSRWLRREQRLHEAGPEDAVATTSPAEASGDGGSAPLGMSCIAGWGYVDTATGWVCLPLPETHASIS